LNQLPFIDAGQPGWIVAAPLGWYAALARVWIVGEREIGNEWIALGGDHGFISRLQFVLLK
jgi:hypothetical protein